MDPSTPPEPQTATPPGVPASHPPVRRRRWLGSLLALLLLALLGGSAWWLVHRSKQPVAEAGARGARGGAAGPGGPPGAGRGGAPSTTVGIATARRAAVPVQLDALGTVTPVAEVTVLPQVAGVLTQVLYREGQMVKKGELLATIDPKPFQAVLAQAQGARQRDEAQLAAAKVTLQRYQTLLGQDSIARQNVDTQAALVKQLEGTVAIDRANEAAAKLNLDYTRIAAPIGGRVGLRPVDAGNYVTAGLAGGIAVITQLTPIDVAFAIAQERIPEVQARLAAGATLAATALDRTRTTTLAEGAFSTLDNQVDIQTGTVKAKARFANADGALFPNQFVNVRLVLRTIEDAVVVPVTALRNGPNGDYVYVLNANDTVTQTAVTRGTSSVDSVVIRSGLAAGQQVVTEGADRLKDGASVRPAAPAPIAATGQGAAVPSAKAPDAAAPPHHGRRQRSEGAKEAGATGKPPAAPVAARAAIGPASGDAAAPAAGKAH